MAKHFVMKINSHLVDKEDRTDGRINFGSLESAVIAVRITSAAAIGWDNKLIILDLGSTGARNNSTKVGVAATVEDSRQVQALVEF